MSPPICTARTARATLDQIRAWDPEIIVTSNKDFAASVAQQSGLGRDRRGQGRPGASAPRLPFGWVDYPPAVNRLIGLWWLGKIFYPERFKEDMRELTWDFYKKFIT